MAVTIALSLTNKIHAALAHEAADKGLDVNLHTVRILELHALKGNSLAEDDKSDLRLSHSLIDRVVGHARALVTASGFPSSITLDAIEAACADSAWMADYRALVRDDPYKNGNPRKQTINQNFGYYIKKTLGAHSIRKSDGKLANVKVIDSIIQSYTPLEA